jgi:Zn-finger nucleic acid-binding protein
LKCPLDDAQLRVVERRGIEIDICPECRGVWLERGELEKLIAAASDADADDAPSTAARRDTARPPAAYPQSSYPRDNSPDSPDSPDSRSRYGDDRGREAPPREGDYEPRRRRRSNWLSDFFGD